MVGPDRVLAKLFRSGAAIPDTIFGQVEDIFSVSDHLKWRKRCSSSCLSGLGQNQVNIFNVDVPLEPLVFLLVFTAMKRIWAC